jgi:hypothetical protein
MYSDYYNDPRSNIRVPKNSRFTRTASNKSKAVGFIALNVRIKGGVNYGLIRKKEQRKFIPPLLSQAPPSEAQHTGNGRSGSGYGAPPQPLVPPQGAFSNAASSLGRADPIHFMDRQESSVSTDLASVRAQRGSSPVDYAAKVGSYDSTASQQNNYPAGESSLAPAPLRQASNSVVQKSMSMNSIDATDGGSDSGSETLATSAPQLHPRQERYHALEGTENSKAPKATKTAPSHAAGSRGNDAATDGSELTEQQASETGQYIVSEQDIDNERPSVTTFYNFGSHSSVTSTGPSSPHSDLATGRSPYWPRTEAVEKTTQDKQAPNFSSTTSTEGLPDRER